MASPDIRPGIQQDKSFPPRIILPDSQPTIQDVEMQIPFNPRLITPDQFRKQLDGDLQAVALISLLETGALGKVAELRPDTRPLDPLTHEEEEISLLIRKRISSQKPVFQPSEFNPDSLFSQIHAIGFPVDERELLKILENERRRAQTEFPGQKFAPVYAPAENIGPFTAARRYLANLWHAARNENPDLRDDFKPLEPKTLPNNASGEQRERYRRQQIAFEAYNFERSLVGVPFS